MFESLNIEMDLKAKAFRRLLEKGQINHKPEIFCDTNWTISLGSLYVSYDLEQSLCDHIQGTELVNHLIRTQKNDNVIHKAHRLERYQRRGKAFTCKRQIMDVEIR